MHGVMSAIHAIELDGGPQVNVTFRPVGYGKVEATRAALELVQEARVHAVIGGGSSSVSSVAQLSFALAGVPQVAYSATSALLSDRTSFPTFSRVVPPDTFQGESLARLCAHLGWRRLAVVSTSDEYGSDLARVFIGALRERGGQELVRTSFSLHSNTRAQRSSFNESVQAVMRSNARVVALFAGSVEAARAFLADGWRAGLRVVYIGTDSWMLANAFASAASQGEDARLAAYAAEGALGTSPRADRSGPDYERFLSHWRVAPGVTTPPELVCDAVCRASEPSWAAQYAYDATRRVHRAWTTLIASADSAADPRNMSTRSLLRAIRSVDLPGGLVTNSSLDPVTGEPRDGFYDLVQLSGSVHHPAVSSSSSTSSSSSRLLQASETIRAVGHVHGAQVSIDAAALRFGAAAAAGLIPGDGTQPFAANSLIELGPWQIATAGSVMEAPIIVKDAFDGIVEPLSADICAALQLRIVRVGSTEPAINSSVGVSIGRSLGNVSATCLSQFVAPTWLGKYEAHVRLFGEPLANSPVKLDVMAASWMIVAITLAVTLTPALCCLLVLACWLRRAARLRRRKPSAAASDTDTQKEVLALFCNPRLPIKMQQAFGVSPLALGQDLKHLLRSMPSSTVAIEPAATLADAQAAIRKHQPRVLIFSGHTIGGRLAFEDARGRLDATAEEEIFKVVSGQSLEQQAEEERRREADEAARMAKHLRPAWFGGKPLPKGRQPGELAGWTAMMGTRVHAKEVEQSMALKAAHGFVRGLGSREEAMAHLRRMNRRDVARTQLGLARHPGDSVLTSPELQAANLAQGFMPPSPPTPGSARERAASDAEHKGPATATALKPHRRSPNGGKGHRRTHSEGPNPPDAAAARVVKPTPLQMWEKRHAPMRSSGQHVATAVAAAPPEKPKLRAAVDDSQLELRSVASEWKQLASWGGFRRAHVQAPAAAAPERASGAKAPPVAKVPSKSSASAARRSKDDGEISPTSPGGSSPRSGPRLRHQSSRRSSQMKSFRRLECVVLCGCSTEPIGRQLLQAAPHLEVICWATLVEDSAARAFSLGVYRSISAAIAAGQSFAASITRGESQCGGSANGKAGSRDSHQDVGSGGDGMQPGVVASDEGAEGSGAGAGDGDGTKRWMRHTCARVLRCCRLWKPAGLDTPDKPRSQLEVAFWAGCDTFAEAGFRCGNPQDYLHRNQHPHLLKPEFSTCTGCSPPVQGLPILLRIVDGEVVRVAPEPYVPPTAPTDDSLAETSTAARSVTSTASSKGLLQGLAQTSAVATSVLGGRV